MVMKTPLKWVGSKARLMPALLPFLPKSKRLVEPFAGSCAVMMNTDYPEYFIADINPDLIGFHRAAAYHSEKLLDESRTIFELGSVGNSEQQALFYYSIREEFNIKTLGQGVSRAARFLYLNRHCYGGICRYNRRGHFNVPFGYYKSPYFPEAEIIAFAEKAKRAQFLCVGYDESLHMVQPGDAIYCDPPYIPLNQTANFTQYHTDGFSADDHYWLSRLLHKFSNNGHSVIASNSDTPEARNLYSSFKQHLLTAPRSIGAAKGGLSSAVELLAVGG